MSRIAEVKDDAQSRLDRARQRSPLLDHLIRTVQLYSSVNGSQQAGAITYYGFLSFFPILAVAFFIVGQLARIYPDARADLITAINEILPGVIGNGSNEIKLSTIESAATTVGALGVLVLMYSGLGWLSSMRSGLLLVFGVPTSEKPNWVIGKLRDLSTLAVIGFVLVLSVAVSGVVAALSRNILDWLGLGHGLGWLLRLISIGLGLAASALLFYLMFRMLARPDVPTRSLWSGALLGAIGFEVLKQLSSVLLASTRDQAAFQAFGIALILLVWINYFSQLVLYAASWAQTAERPGRHQN